MCELLENRFMQAVLSESPIRMTNEELYAEFGKFQTTVLELLFSTRGYLSVDFILNDCYSLLAELRRTKKKSALVAAN